MLRRLVRRHVSVYSADDDCAGPDDMGGTSSLRSFADIVECVSSLCGSVVVVPEARQEYLLVMHRLARAGCCCDRGSYDLQLTRITLCARDPEVSVDHRIAARGYLTIRANECWLIEGSDRKRHPRSL